MKWSHKVDAEWLQMRKNYLSASDIKKLIPVTPTGRPRSNMEENFLKVWADKKTRIAEDDVCSSGVMARGHLLEPYAIEAFNKQGVAPYLYHWDDCLIYQSSTKMSYSPDALSERQVSNCPVSLASVDATFHGEVKSYRADMHYAIGLSTSKMSFEERWQIASAFYVSPTLMNSALILYNPSAEHPLFYHLYERADLADELDMINAVCIEYWRYAVEFEELAVAKCPASTAALCDKEEDIIASLIAQGAIDDGLNP